MFNGLRLTASLLLFAASFGLHATPQIAEPINTLAHTSAASSISDFSTWLLLAAGATGVVIARKRT